MSSPTLSNHARAYAARGWHVFPIRPGSKEPLTAHGFKDATTDPAQIATWWRRWPDANIGVTTGASGLLALDVDPRHGGDESLRDLEAQHGPLPSAPEVSTASGGRHIYFRAPANVEVRSSAGRLGPGLDVRAQGGYVVMPPSRNGTGAWVWDALLDDSTPLLEPPAWLLDLLTARPIRVSSGGASDVPARIPPGQRHHALTSLAGTLRRRGLEADEITDMLAVVNARRCAPPLPDAEVRAIAASVARYEADDPLTGGESEAASGSPVGAEHALLWNVVANTSLGDVPRRVVAARLVVEVDRRQRRDGEAVTIPTLAIARAVGLSEDATGAHIRALCRRGDPLAGLIERVVEKRNSEQIDPETGAVKRVVKKWTEYRLCRPRRDVLRALAATTIGGGAPLVQRGGKRERRPTFAACTQHPHAGAACAECTAPLKRTDPAGVRAAHNDAAAELALAPVAVAALVQERGTSVKPQVAASDHQEGEGTGVVLNSRKLRLHEPAVGGHDKPLPPGARSCAVCDTPIPRSRDGRETCFKCEVDFGLNGHDAASAPAPHAIAMKRCTRCGGEMPAGRGVGECLPCLAGARGD